MNDSLKYISELINSPSVQFAMQNAKTIQEAKGMWKNETEC